MPWCLWCRDLVLVLASCNSEPQTWKALQRATPDLDAAAQDALVEKFVASKGGTPIVENQTRLIFLAKDKERPDAAHCWRFQ